MSTKEAIKYVWKSVLIIVVFVVLVNIVGCVEFAVASKVHFNAKTPKVNLFDKVGWEDSEVASREVVNAADIVPIAGSTIVPVAAPAFIPTKVQTSERKVGFAKFDTNGGGI